MKKIILALIAVLLLILTGCTQTTQLNERLLVQAVGVDYEDGQYVLTVQVFSPEGSGSQGNFNPSDLNNQLYQAKGDSISDAFREIGQDTGKKVFLGSNRFVVIGEATAEKKLFQILNYFNSNTEVRPKMLLLISRSTGERIVSTQIKQGIVPAASVQRMVDMSSDNGRCFKSTILSTVRSLATEGESAVLTYVDTEPDFKDKTTVEILGSIVIDNNGIDGYLDVAQSRGSHWIMGTIRDTTMVLIDGENRYAVRIKPNFNKIKVKIKDGHPLFNLETELICSITEVVRSDGKGIEMDDIPMLTNLIESSIRQDVELARQKLLDDIKADIFGVRKYLERYCYDYYEKNKDNLTGMYSQIDINMQVRANISELGLGTNIVVK